MLDMDKVVKVLCCKEIKRPGVYVSDDTYTCQTDGVVVKGDCFVVMSKGIAKVVEVIEAVPLWAYSNERKGWGNPDTMSWAISKVDFKTHSIMKEARSKIRDLRAALAEKKAKYADAKSMDDFMAGLKKKDAAEVKETLALIEELENNPEKASELGW